MERMRVSVCATCGTKPQPQHVLPASLAAGLLASPSATMVCRVLLEVTVSRGKTSKRLRTTRRDEVSAEITADEWQEGFIIHDGITRKRLRSSRSVWRLWRGTQVPCEFCGVWTSTEVCRACISAAIVRAFRR